MCVVWIDMVVEEGGVVVVKCVYIYVGMLCCVGY